MAIRHQENVLTRAMTLSRGNVLSLEAVETALGGGGSPPAGAGAAEAATAVVPLRDAEKAHVEKALRAFGWNITRTARALEISPTTLRKKIQDFGIRR